MAQRVQQADSIRRELIALAGPDGMINVRAAHDWAARHPESHLYNSLEWDDEKAATEYRLQQIRRLISIHVVDDKGEREYISLSIDRNPKGGYRPIQQVLASEDLRDIMMRDALAELQRFENKYKRLTKLTRVYDAAQKVREEEERETRKREEAAKAKPKPKPKRKR